MTTETVGTKPNRRRHRSPSYPAIDLETALQKARVLLEKEGRHAAPMAAVVEHWGYTQKSSAGMLTIAALKKFGLVDEDGAGTCRSFSLSQLALRILLDERSDSPERGEAVKEAALRPAIHAELWNKYGGSAPSDQTLRHYLRLERNFADSAVSDFISEFRRTIAFAELDDSDTLPEESSETTTLRASGQTSVVASVSPSTSLSSPAPPQLEAALDAVVLPISATERAVLRAPFPLSESAWRQMLSVLNAMKPALVEEPEPNRMNEPE